LGGHAEGAVAGEKLLKAWINPVQFIELDVPWAPPGNPLPSHEALLDFLCTPGLPSDPPSLVARYREISTEKHRLFAAPVEQRILDKLVWPLRHAKASYMVGNFLGTISLCGMVAEMVAILRLDLAELQINRRLMSEGDQKALFGSTFEKLNQDRRVNVLRAYSLIPEDEAEAFTRVRLIRRKYLHLWSQDHEQLATDAVSSFHAAMLLVTRVIGQELREGKILLNPAMEKYLERKGVYEPAE
jgi:hypothetical protein